MPQVIDADCFEEKQRWTERMREHLIVHGLDIGDMFVNVFLYDEVG